MTTAPDRNGDAPRTAVPSIAPVDAPKRLQTAELLRVVLGRMSAHADGYEPVSYAVWYEYARGGVPKLREEVDGLIATTPRLTTAQTQALFDKHVRDRPEAAFATARTGLLAVLNRMEATIGNAVASSDAYGNVLEALETDLTRATVPLDVQKQLAGVAAHTNEIRESISTLNHELLSNREQVGRLTEELNKLREDVQTDPLTGLVNRRGFDAKLVALKQAAESGGETFSIVILDIDHFKRINDTHGHLVGDRVIQQVATTMKSCVRGGDTAVRYGGEEFALLLPSTSTRGARTVAEYIGNALRRAHIGSQKQDVPVGPVTVSAGVAEFRPGELVEDCVRRADQALYAAKNAGRDRVHVAG